MLEENLKAPTTLKKIRDRIDRKVKAPLRRAFGLKEKKVPRQLNACSWFVHGDIKTRIVFYNYFWRNHHEEVIRLDMQLIDAQGAERWRETRVVRQDETFVISSDELARNVGFQSFDGYMVFTLNTSKVPPFIDLIRFNTDYYSDTGQISTVHDQAIFAPTPPGAEHSLGKMEIVENERFGTAVILFNSESYANVDVVADITVHDSAGRAFEIGRFQLTPRQLMRVELAPAQDFLRGGIGHVSVQTNCYIKRCAIVQYSKIDFSSWYSVNHSEEYRARPPYLHQDLAMTSTDKDGSAVSVPFIHGIDDLTTSFVAFQDVPLLGAQTYGVRLYDHTGQLIVDRPEAMTVAPEGLSKLSVRSLLPSDASCFGLAQVYLAPTPFNQKWLPSFPVNTHYTFGENEWTAMYSQASAFGLNRIGEKKDRTRVFGRVYCDEQLQTDLFFIYPTCERPGAKDQLPSSHTLVTICRPDGHATLTRTLSLRPAATEWVKILDLFPEIKNWNLVAGQPCGVYVRDVTAKVVVSHLTRNSRRDRMGVDHFYGG